MAPCVRARDINQTVQKKIRILTIIFTKCLEFSAVCRPYFLSWIIGCSCCALLSTFPDFILPVAAYISERKYIKACLPNNKEWLTYTDIPSITFIPQNSAHLWQLEKLLFQALSSLHKMLLEFNLHSSSHKVLDPNSAKHFKLVNDCTDFNPQVKLRLYFISWLHQHFFCLSSI